MISEGQDLTAKVLEKLTEVATGTMKKFDEIFFSWLQL